MRFNDKLHHIRTINKPVSNEELSKGHFPLLLDMNKGDVVRLEGVQYLVSDKLMFNFIPEGKKKGEGFGKWNEYRLINLEDFEVCYLEVEDDDGDHLCNLTVESIPQGRIQEVARGFASDRKNGAPNKLMIDGLNDSYYLDEAYSAIAKDGNGKENPVTMFDYESEKGDLISIEQWSDGKNYRVYRYRPVELRNLEVTNYGK